jgi:hypothetical protein
MNGSLKKKRRRKRKEGGGDGFESVKEVLSLARRCETIIFRGQID